MSKRIFLAMFLIILVLGRDMAIADVVFLKNGDRITGQVVTMEKDKLVVKTPYAGDITITWTEVANLTTDTPITVIFSDKTSLQGLTEPATAGNMKLKPEKIIESVAFELAEITTINPKPKPVVKIKVRANLGASATEGNTDTQGIYFDGQFVANTKKNRIRFLVVGSYHDNGWLRG
jgi:hypothetical protein